MCIVGLTTKQGMNWRRLAAELPSIESDIPRFPANEPGWADLAFWIRKEKQVNLAGKGIIPGELITRGKEIIFSFSYSEGNPCGECAVSIVEDVGMF